MISDQKNTMLNFFDRNVIFSFHKGSYRKIFCLCDYKNQKYFLNPKYNFNLFNYRLRAYTPFLLPTLFTF